MRIDLNADVGEGYGWDEALLDVVSSANIACGGHAGDAASMAAVCRAAARRGVTVGAHPSYPDRSGFGRVSMELSSAELEASVAAQIDALQEAAASAGTKVAYVKPHGALYNDLVWDESRGATVLRALSTSMTEPVLLHLPGSATARLAGELGIPVVAEAFADRTYRPDGTLTPRSEPGAVLTDLEEIAARVPVLVRELQAQSLCVHGDTPGALAIAQAVRQALEADGCEIRAFA